MLKRPKPVFRILIVEDDADRARTLQEWLPEEARAVVVTSAGKAMGLLKRDRGNVYAGILLDHDLQQQVATESDLYLSGEQVVDAVVRYVSRDVPVLVHSVSIQGSLVMTRKLEAAGFWVTRIPIDQLQERQFMDWLEDAREIWEDQNEGGGNSLTHSAIKLSLADIEKHYLDEGGHGWNHVVRVHRMAIWIAAQVGAEEEIVEAAALLHDIARSRKERGECKCHAQKGAKMATSIFVSIGFLRRTDKKSPIALLFTATRRNSTPGHWRPKSFRMQTGSTP